MKADAHLKSAADALRDRAAFRDADDGERSMCATVAAFNAIFDTNLTEEMGWQFMVLLKIVRGSQGVYLADDYTDQAGYSALAGEAAERDSPDIKVQLCQEGIHRYVTVASNAGETNSPPQCLDCGASIFDQQLPR